MRRLENWKQEDLGNQGYTYSLESLSGSVQLYQLFWDTVFVQITKKYNFQNRCQPPNSATIATHVLHPTGFKEEIQAKRSVPLSYLADSFICYQEKLFLYIL